MPPLQYSAGKRFRPQANQGRPSPETVIPAALQGAAT